MDFLFDVEQELSQGADPDVEVAQIQAVYGSKKRTVVCKHWLRGLCKKGCAARALSRGAAAPTTLAHLHARRCSNRTYSEP